MMPFYFKDENIVVDLREFRKVTRYLPRKWVSYILVSGFFIGLWAIDVCSGDTCESIVDAAIGMYCAYRGTMCVAKGEDWKNV